MNFRTHTLITLAALLPLELLASDPVRLLYRFKKNDAYVYQSQSTFNQNFDVNNTKMNAFVETALNLRLEVTDVVLSLPTLKFVVSDLHNRTRLKGMGPAIDTSLNFNDAQKVEMTAVVQPTGKVVSHQVELLETTPVSLIVADLLESSKAFWRLMIEFPARDVHENSTWEQPLSDTVKAPGIGKVVASGTMRYEYKGLVDTAGRTCWKIEIKADRLNFDIVGNATNKHINLEGDGQMRGVVYHDANNGVMVFYNMESMMDASLTVAADKNVVIPIKTHESYSTRLVSSSR